MARTQSFSIRDFSGGMVQGVGDRDLAPNQFTDLKGFDNKKGTMLRPLPSISGIRHIEREDDDPTGFDLQKVPRGSYGCYGFGTDHTLEGDTAPTNFAFTSEVITTGRKTQWRFYVEYDWNIQWADTTWNIDAAGYGTINTFESADDLAWDFSATWVAPYGSGQLPRSYGWILVINTQLGVCTTAIDVAHDDQDTLDVMASLPNGFDTAYLVDGTVTQSGSAGTYTGDPDPIYIKVESRKDGTTYADLELSIYSTTSSGASG